MYAVFLLMMFPVVFLEVFTHLPDFMKEIVSLKKASRENLVKGLDEFIQNFCIEAAVIFTLNNLKRRNESKQQ